jgi:dTDP-4-dehydrorhamnose reductase
MKILVTGANGLVGRKTIQALQNSNNHKIFATSQKRVPLHGDVEFFTVNLIYSDTNKLIDTIKPDVLIHCAAIASPDACEVDRYSCKKLNVEVTSRLVSACRDYGTHLVFLSTDCVFDGKTGNYLESDATTPLSYYGESKLEAESIIQGMNIGAAIVRTSLVFGYDEHLSRTNIAIKVIDHLKNGKPYKVPFDQLRTPTFAEDLALALVHIAEEKKQGIYHIAGGEKISVFEFAKKVSTTFGFDASLLIPATTKELSEPASRPLDSSLDITKAINELQYKPTPLDDALILFKDQYKKNSN